MNWILAFNIDFTDPKPMSQNEAEKTVQELASKVSRQFTKGKMAYSELNDALSASYSDAVATLMEPLSQSEEAKRIVYDIIAGEVAIFGNSVPQDQIVNIKKAVINKVKSDYSLPVYKFLDGSDKEATEARIREIIESGIEAAGAHIAGEDEENGYSSAVAKERFDALQEAFASADKEYAQINKSLSKLGMANLYALVGEGNEASAKVLPTAMLQTQLKNLKGEFESGAEIENLKHLANDVFASDPSRKKYDVYLDLSEKEAILKNLESRSFNGAINSKLFMEAAMQLNALFEDSNEALLLLYGFADSKGLDTGTDFAMMESVFVMMRNEPSQRNDTEAARTQQDTSSESDQPRATTQQDPPSAPDPRTRAQTANNSQSGYQRSDEWRHKSPQDYSPEDFYNAYQAAKEWRDKRQESKGKKQEPTQAADRVVVKSKNKTVAALLAIFLGCLGAQKFYLGHPKQGITTLLITFIGAGIVIGPFITFIIGIVEGIKYLTRSPEQFEQTYVLEGKTWL